MGGSSVQFQTPTALYEALAGQGRGGLFGSTPFPQLSNGFGYGQFSPYLSLLTGIEGLNPTNVYKGTGAQDYFHNPISQNTNALASAGAGELPFVGQALQQGFDPQNALFNKLFQQQQDQSNAENAMAGVATTPYGAALTQQGNQNFDLAWQQQQLANQAQGANTAGSLLGSAGGAISAPANLTQQQIQDYLAYISANTANSAAFTSGTNAATNAGANSTNALVNAQNAANSGKSGIGSALGGIGKLAGMFIPGLGA